MTDNITPNRPAGDVTRIQVDLTVEPGHFLVTGGRDGNAEREITDVTYVAHSLGWTATAYAADNSNRSFYSATDAMPDWFPPPPEWFLPAAEALSGARDE